MLSFAASGAQAEDYPSRPIRIVVGYAPGSASDITVRIIGPKLSQVLTLCGHREPARQRQQHRRRVRRPCAP